MLTMNEPEMDVADAIARREHAAEQAKRLEDEGDGWAALAAWKEYELIAAAIDAQERSHLAAERAQSNAAAHRH
jgi:hypothetical protein